MNFQFAVHAISLNIELTNFKLNSKLVLVHEL